MPINLDNVTNIMLGNTPVEQVTDSQGNVLWSSAVDPSTVYFYVEDVSGKSNTLTIKKSHNNAPTVTVYKSTDQTNWSSMGNTSTTGITATIPANGKLYLKATANNWSKSGYYNNITASGAHNIGGNIMSLLYGDNFQGQTTFPSGSKYNFKSIFNSNTKLVSAASLALPATTLVDYCYSEMFYSCNHLTTAPELPATTLASYCYQYMFWNCVALTTAPELPATTLVDYCYEGMFWNCTSLTQAPELPATTLVIYCYNCMFWKCIKINFIITYATSISAPYCLNNWLSGVAATGDFYNLGRASYPSGASGIPTGWTKHTSL